MPPASIDSRLSGDCHHLTVIQGHNYLLNKNALIPWIIIVPNTEVIELHDLEPEACRHLMQLVQSTGRFMKQYFAADKINTATIGNIVPQLHMHVIARTRSDACWPGVVWGNLDQHETYSDTRIAAIARALDDALQIRPEPSP